VSSNKKVYTYKVTENSTNTNRTLRIVFGLDGITGELRRIVTITQKGKNE
jgi:hypothetical protein